MFLIIGLGNPGRKYLRTRHNLGWIVLDLIQKKWRKEYNFSKWKEARQMEAEVSEGMIKNKVVVLSKPQTFMNLSGKAVKSLNTYYETKPRDLIVVHDDIDISVGNMKIVENRGAAGHKGVNSIIEELKIKNFVRLRIGIKPKNKKPKNTDKFVLLKFYKDEEKIINKTTERAAEAIEMIIKKGLRKAMNEFN